MILCAVTFLSCRTDLTRSALFCCIFKLYTPVAYLKRRGSVRNDYDRLVGKLPQVVEQPFFGRFVKRTGSLV